MSPMTILSEVTLATAQTVYMVSISTLLATLLGLPLGTLLYSSHAIKPCPVLYRCLSWIINIARSVPFIILLVAIIPFTRWIIGSSIGIHAAMVPLTLGAVPFFARLIDNAYRNLPQSLIETGHAMGASTWQMIRYLFFPEVRAALIQSVTLTAITLVNYSAMAGTVGGGGLGDLAIRHGYQRFNISIMLITIVILVIIVQGLQYIGDRAAHYYKR